MSTKMLVMLLTVTISLSACGTFVPNLQELPGDDRDGMLLVHAVVDSIHCEVRNAVYSVIKNDLDASQYNGGVRHAKYLYDWAAQIGLTLQVEEKTTLNPTTAWSPPSALTSIFTLSGSGLLSTDATRIDKLNYYYTVKELYALGPCPTNFNPPHPLGSLLIQSDLKLNEWLSSQVLEVGTGDLSVPINVNSALKQNALSHEVKFEVVSTGSVTPAWKLRRVTINQTGAFFAATRDRTHDLLITFGPVDPKQKGSLAPTAQNLFLSSQFGIAVSNGVRNGILP